MQQYRRLFNEVGAGPSAALNKRMGFVHENKHKKKLAYLNGKFR